MAGVDARERLLAIAARVGGPVLALDASTMAGSLCVVAPPDEVREIALPVSTAPSEALVVALANELSPAAVADLRAIVVGVGPGSFTGLRVALATVKGMAFATGVQVYGVSSLALIAASAGPGRMAVVLDARRGDVFAAIYDVASDGAIIDVLPDSVLTPDDFVARCQSLAPEALIGDVALVPGVAVARRIEVATARAAAGLLLCSDRIARGAADDIAALVPRYLRVSEAERQEQLRGQAPLPG